MARGRSAAGPMPTLDAYSDAAAAAVPTQAAYAAAAAAAESRGMCGVCGEHVFIHHERTSDDAGVYYHSACFAKAREAMALAAVEHRGQCGLCGEDIYTNQHRAQDSDGNYYHQACAAAATANQAAASGAAGLGLGAMPVKGAASAAPPFAGQLRGECGRCGEGVYSSQERFQNDDGVYFHKACPVAPAGGLVGAGARAAAAALNVAAPLPELRPEDAMPIHKAVAAKGWRALKGLITTVKRTPQAQAPDLKKGPGRPDL